MTARQTKRSKGVEDASQVGAALRSGGALLATLFALALFSFGTGTLAADSKNGSAVAGVPPGDVGPSDFKAFLDPRWKVRSVVFWVRGEEHLYNGKPDTEPHLSWGTMRAADFALGYTRFGRAAIQGGEWKTWGAKAPQWLFDGSSLIPVAGGFMA